MRMKAIRRHRNKAKRFSVVSARKSLPRTAQFPPHRGALGICAANPRVAVGNPPFGGVTGNTALLQVFVGDASENTTCEYNVTRPGIVLCTGEQIAPYFVLTAAHCLAGDQLVDQPGCENSGLFDVIGKPPVISSSPVRV